MKDKTPEQVKLEKTVLEYTELVTNPINNIGLIGHQPRLQKIRKAWHSKKLTHQELGLVLTSLAQTLNGEQEAFKSKEKFREYLGTRHKVAIIDELPPSLTESEQITKIQDILGDKPKKRKKFAPKQPKKVEININHLPESLRHIAR